MTAVPAVTNAEQRVNQLLRLEVAVAKHRERIGAIGFESDEDRELWAAVADLLDDDR